MRYARVLSILIVCVVSFAWTSGATANWYAGNIKSSGFGVFARIWTPASAPNIAWVTPPGHSGEASWVAATNPNATVFVQAGWSYFPFDGVTPAKSYTEGKQHNLHWLKFYAVQPWNTAVKYTVENNPIGGSCWRASFASAGDGDAWCILETPAIMETMLEIQGSTSNTANTAFRKVHYKQGDGTWVNFDEANWVENAPYRILDKTFLFKWNSVGP